MMVFARLRFLLTWTFAVSLITCGGTQGQETPAPAAQIDQGATDSAAAEASKSIPDLSVRTLFHPQERIDYFGPAPPSTLWLEDSRLAVEMGDSWEVVDPATGEKSAWQWPRQLRDELGQLTGFTESDLTAAVSRAIRESQSLDDPRLIRIGRSLAIVGGQNPPTVVTRDARGWDMADLSPDGGSVAFVRDNDLFVVKVDTGEVLRLTQNGSETLLNGKLDWTYQEEIYGRGNFKGFWWSPDSRHLAFLSIDTSDVLDFTLVTSDTPRGGTLVTAYPKAGDPIPKATLMVVDTETLQATTIHRPQGEEAESLVVRVTWRPDGRRLAYQIQNRIQTWLELRQAEISGTNSRVLVREEGPAWVEILGEPIWLEDGDFLWLSDLPAGRRHVWLVSEDGSRRIPITTGDWDVREIVRVDSQSKTLFVTGDRDRGIQGQQLYRVSWRGNQPREDAVQRLTQRQGWHDVTVSPDGHWFTDTFSSLTTEPIKYLVDAGGEQSVLLGPKSEGASKWRKLPLSTPRWLDITAADGTPLPAYLIPPRDVQLDSAEERFPVLVETYGGPQAPSAVDRWNGREYLFRQLLASRGIGVLVVDNRSSGGRGIADTWTIHRRVGVQELDDLLSVVEFLKETNWADADRLAIRGWSFGGFYTAYAMTHSQAFAAGVAGGSVTDWRNYDAFYTERYMDTPQNNPDGYRQTSVIEKAKDLHGRLLLIHGEVDDNVHPANTLQLVAALQEAGKQFELMIYPGAQHGIRDTEQVFHMRKMITDFLVRTLTSRPKVQRAGEQGGGES
jgi:dipeptidyl-peptidase-4